MEQMTMETTKQQETNEWESRYIPKGNAIVSRLQEMNDQRCELVKKLGASMALSALDKDAFQYGACVVKIRSTYPHKDRKDFILNVNGVDHNANNVPFDLWNDLKNRLVRKS
jgi:hypothetical protein